MARPKNFHELIVWQKAMSLASSVYQTCDALQKHHAYALMNQMRRAAISIPSNIAEGHGRLTDLQFRHFLGNARGSLFELQTQLELAAELGYLDKQQVHTLLDQSNEVGRLVNGLLVSMTRSRVAMSANSANTAIAANSALAGER